MHRLRRSAYHVAGLEEGDRRRRVAWNDKVAVPLATRLSKRTMIDTLKPVERAVEAMLLSSCDTVLVHPIALVMVEADEPDKIHSATFGYRALLYMDIPFGCIMLTRALHRVWPCAFVNEEMCPP